MSAASCFPSAPPLSMLLMGFCAPFVGRLCRPLRLGPHHRRRRRALCAGHGRHRHHARRRHADPGQHPGRHRPVGRLLRPGAGRDPARGAAGEGRRWRSASARPAARSASSSSCRWPRCCRAISATGGPTMWALTALAVLIMLLPLGLNDSQPDRRRQQGRRRQADLAARRCREAFGQRSYVLLVIGFFVCGFHVAFVGGHLPAYISDKGIGLSLFGVTLSPAELGGWSIGMVGLFNIAGSILWSAMGEPAPAQEPAVAALPAALAGLPGLRAGAAVGRLGADLRRRRSASCGSAPCRSPPRWSATCSGRCTSPC